MSAIENHKATCIADDFEGIAKACEKLTLQKDLDSLVFRRSRELEDAGLFVTSYKYKCEKCLDVGWLLRDIPVYKPYSLIPATTCPDCNPNGHTPFPPTGARIFG